MRLVIFDFDGTLIKKDSLGEFLKYYYDKEAYLKKIFLFLPTFLLYKLKLIKNDIAKQKLIKIFFENEDEDIFKKKAKKFALERVDTFLNDKIYKQFQSHKLNGDRIIIISASFECWISQWAKKEEVEFLSTILEIKDNRLTGRFYTENCYGKEKVNRLKNYLDISKYDDIISYGDSKGDEYIFKISTQFYKV